MAQVSGVEVRFTGDTSGLERSINRANSVITGFAKNALAGLAGALTVGAFVQAGRAALNFADDIGKMAQKVGMTTEALSKLTYAAKLSDVSMQELQVGVQQLAKNMEAGSEGLAALGISATDSAGNLRSTSEVFADVAEAFANMEDGAGKTAIAMNIFGRSGAQLIPLLNSGRAGLKGMGDEAQRLGVVISGDSARAAEKFNDNLTRLQEAASGLAQQVTQDLLPSLIGITEALLEIVKAGSPARQFLSDTATFLEEWGPSLSNTRREIESITEALRYLGILDPKPLEINVPGGGLPTAPGGSGGTKNKAPSLGGGDKSKDSGSDMRVPGVAGVDAVDSFFIERLAAIQEGFQTEREMLAAEYAANLDVLNGALNNQLLSEEEHRRLVEQLEQQHQDNLSKIRQEAIGVQLDAAASLFGSLASLMDGGNKKMAKLAKAFAATQVVINTAQGISKAFAQFGWPAGIGPAAAIAASGAAQLASIANAESGKIKGSGGGGGRRSTSSSDSGGGASGGGSGPTTTFQFTLMNDPMGFGEKFARQFIDQLNSTQRNGGQIRGVIA